MNMCCSKSKPQEKKRPKAGLLIQNQELLRLRLTHEEKVFYTQLFYDNAVGGKVLKNNFLPLLGMLGTQIAEEFAERIFLAFSSNKKDITLCEYLKYIDIYHYGDDRERCRVTCKLIDKNSTGLIKLEDFKSYINLIMNAVKKVNGGSNDALMSDQDIRDLFYHISKDKESFTYQEFEDLYKEKPELISWFDYFKNNKEDLLLIINSNMNNLLDIIKEFLQSFMDDVFKVLEQEQEIDISVLIQKVYFYSNELEKIRKKFLKKISKFNIRTTFDKLQNNVQNQKTVDLINTLQKKILNEENNLPRDNSSSFQNKQKKNGLVSFNTINVGARNKDFGSSLGKRGNDLMHATSIQENTSQENAGMAKFFKKIKNNLDRTLSYKNDASSDKNQKYDDKSSSSSEDNNEDMNDFSNDFIKKNADKNDFAKNFVKQQTLFEAKVIKFNNAKKVRKSKMLNDNIEELDDEDEYDNYTRKNSQDFTKNNPTYVRIRNSIFKNIDLDPKIAKDADDKKYDTTIIGTSVIKASKKELISPYDTSDYDTIIKAGSLDESDINLENKKNKTEENGGENNIGQRRIKRMKSDGKAYNKPNYQINIKQLENDTNSNGKNYNNNNKNNNMNIKLENQGIYIKEIKALKKQSNNLNQLLFCSRVAIENSLEVCQTISSCYKWINENYLVAQIKKVVKEAKLKQKQKEDKEKYGNIGNVPNKDKTKKQQNIIRASDQSFKLLLNMIMGIQIAVQSIPNFHIKSQENLNKYLNNMLYSIQTINFDKKKEEVFILKEFAGIIFNNIRLYLGFDKDDFIASISPQDFITELMISNQTIFEELCSTGKSGSLFYYTRDGKFIVKTIKKDEYKFIKLILPDYFRHLKTYPLSLLPKFLGCYVLTRKFKKKRTKIYFIVMLNVFATSKHIHIRYDLKGSRIGRRVLTGKRDQEIMAKGDLSLKDLDLEKRKEKMYVGEKSEILLNQIKHDADFLCKIEVNDYSLLLGIHYINRDKKLKSSGSFDLPTNKINNNEDSFIKESSLSDKSCDSRQEKLKTLVDFEDGGIISETGNEIYYVGIIDILTKFNLKKKCEHFIKMVRYCSNNMSCTPPDMYRDRFVDYMGKVIVKSSSFKSDKNPLLEKFKSGEFGNNSNNILIQNNTSNFYNIINNNNNIMMNSIEDHTPKNVSVNSTKKEKFMFNFKYNTEEVIKEESEHGGNSIASSKNVSDKNKNLFNSNGSEQNAEEEKI